MTNPPSILKRVLVHTAFLSTALLLLYWAAGQISIGYALPCPFHSLTGLWCPGCGGQRALFLLLQGDVVASFRSNIFLIPIIVFLFYWYVDWVEQTFFEQRKKLYTNHTTNYFRLILWIVLIYFVLRNLPFFPFTYLAPPVK